MLELQFLVSLVIQHKVPLTNGDINQAFVQATLPPDEKYVLHPLASCHRSPTNTYWLLKRTLYGLKFYPCCWFTKQLSSSDSVAWNPPQKHIIPQETQRQNELYSWFIVWRLRLLQLKLIWSNNIWTDTCVPRNSQLRGRSELFPRNQIPMEKSWWWKFGYITQSRNICRSSHTSG